MRIKLKIMMVSLFLITAMTSCVKEGDFEALKHPLEIQGDFDPVFGFPVAKMSADMNTFIDMFDSAGRWSATVNGDGIVALHLCDTMQARLNWVVRKGETERPKASADTMTKHINITGTQTTNLFNTLQSLEMEGVTIEHLMTQVDADVKAYISETFYSLLDRGIRITFDSMKFVVACSDGHSETMKTECAGKRYDLRELVDGCNILVLKDADMSIFTTHKPMYVLYSIRMNLDIPYDQLIDGEDWLNLDDVGVDSVTAAIHTDIEIPLTGASSKFGIHDTVPLDLADMDSTLAEIREYATLGNDDKSYIALVIDNGLPVGVSLGASLMDADSVCITKLLKNDTVLKAAPIVPSADGTTNIAQGSEKSIVKITINQSLLDQLAKTRYLGFDVDMRTSNNGATVSVLPENRVNVRAYIVANPHVSIRVPLQ